MHFMINIINTLFLKETFLHFENIFFLLFLSVLIYLFSLKDIKLKTINSTFEVEEFFDFFNKFLKIN